VRLPPVTWSPIVESLRSTDLLRDSFTEWELVTTSEETKNGRGLFSNL
jgi:hypothetical protein